MKWLLAGVLLIGTPALGLAQEPAPSAVNTGAATAAFQLHIEAPDAVRTVLQQHVELLRYRELSDLSDAELSRLLTAAELDARDLLGAMGYFTPEVHLAQRTAADSPVPRVVTLTVVPGAPTTVEQVDVELIGAISTDPAAAALRQQIEASSPLRRGMRFTQAAWDATKQHALRQLTASRYPTALLSIKSQADIDAPSRSARLTIRLDSGPAYKLGGLQINGLQRHDAALVTRLARLSPGTDYNQLQLVRAQQRLADSGFFDSVYVSLDTSGEPTAAPVLVQVREARLQKLVLGIGASTDSGARLSAEHTHHKVPWLGWRALSKLSLQRDQRALGTELTAPPDGDHWAWVAAAQTQSEHVSGLTVHSQRIRGGRNQTGERIDRTYFLQYDRADTANANASGSATAQSITANYTFTLRNFDSLPFPAGGWGLGVEVGGGSTLGSARDPYARILGRWRSYRTLGTPLGAVAGRGGGGERARLVMRAELGAVLAKTGVSLPSTQLFLTGGDTSVRGYGRHDIGVTLPTGQINAGRYLANGSVEWQQPIRANGRPTDWEGALFIDAGAVADRPADLRAKVGVGAGVRWKSPIGPLQIDLAYGVAAKQLRLHMNVGFSF